MNLPVAVNPSASGKSGDVALARKEAVPVKAVPGHAPVVPKKALPVMAKPEQAATLPK